MDRPEVIHMHDIPYYQTYRHQLKLNREKQKENAKCFYFTFTVMLIYIIAFVYASYILFTAKNP